MDDTNGNGQRLELGPVQDSMTKSVVALRPKLSLDDAALELERAKVDVVTAVARAHERAGGRDDASLHPRMTPD
jgi:hypothetical protein